MAVAFSPRGNVIASTGWDGKIRLWNLANGAEIAKPQSDSFAYALAFSPDGRLLAVSGQEGYCGIRDARTGKTLRKLEGLSGDVTAVTFSADGRCLCAGDENGRTIIWDVATGEPRKTIEDGNAPVSCVAYSPGGAVLAITGGDSSGSDPGAKQRYFRTGSNRVSKKVFLVDARSYRPLVTLEPGLAFEYQYKTESGCFYSQNMRSAFSPEGDTIAVAVEANRIGRWEVPSGKRLADIPCSLEHPMLIAYSPNGKYLAAAGDWPMRVELIDTRTGAAIRSFAIRPEFQGDGGIYEAGGPVETNALAFSPDGKTLALASGDTATYLWDVPTGKRLLTYGHDLPVRSLAFLADGSGIVTGGDDGIVCLWNAATGALLWHQYVGRPISRISSGPGRRCMAVESWDGVRLLDLATGLKVPPPSFAKTKDRVWEESVRFSANGKIMASRGGEGIVAWDTETGKKIWSSKEVGGRMDNVVVSANGRVVATNAEYRADRFTTSEYSLIFWDTQTGRKIRTVKDTGFTDHWGLVLSPDGNFFAYRKNTVGPIAHHGDVWVGEVRSDQKAMGPPTWDDFVNCLAFCPGAPILAGGSGEKLWVWRIGSEEPVTVHEQPGNTVRAAAFSTDGRRLAASFSDTTVLVWDVERFTGRLARPRK